MTSRSRTVALRLLQIFVTAAAFSLLNRAASFFQIEPGVSVVFPATAVAIVACMHFGIYAAIGIFIGTVATPWSNAASTNDLIASGAVNVLEGLIPYFVFRYWRDAHRDLRDTRSLTLFVVFGAVFNTAISAYLGNALLVHHQLFFAPGHDFLVWWIADFTAAVLIAAPVLAFTSQWIRPLVAEYKEPAPRRLSNVLQVTAIIILLGWIAAAGVRSYLIDRIEQERLHQQEQLNTAAHIVVLLHANYLASARALFELQRNPTPQLQQALDTARLRNEEMLDQLTPLVAASTPATRRDFAKLRGMTRSWYARTMSGLAADASDGPGGARSIGRQVVSLESSMNAGATVAWKEFATKRRRLMTVSIVSDLLVFVILLLAAVHMIFQISIPLETIHTGIRSLTSDHVFDAASVDTRFEELLLLATTLERTSVELRQREAELREQTENAIAAARAKSEFLAKMSHELRTPLNSIVGFSELLINEADGITDAKREKFMLNIGRSGKHLLTLIDELLDIARLEAGRMTFDLIDIDIRRVISSAVTLSRPRFEDKDQKLDLALPVDPLMVRADPARTEQALQHLLSNANKFSFRGDCISVSASSTQQTCRIEVRDHGIGIRSDEQHRIFKEFEQVHQKGAHSTGTGLGLTLAKRFVEAQGGTISVESTAGAGAVFAIELPLTKSTATPEPSAWSEAK